MVFNAGTIAVFFTGDLKGLENAVNRAGKKITKTGQTMTRVGGQMTTGLTLPMLAIGGAASKMAVDFDREMTKIETLVGVAREQVDGWRGDLRGMAEEVGRGPRELARAMFVVTSAGKRGGAALEIVESAAKASAVGLGETATIARSVTAAMTAYGEENLNAEQATNILIGTVREGNLEASDLAGSLGRVIGIASQLGVTFGDVGGFIATFTRLGVNAEESVTSLRGVMNAVLKPTRDSEKALDAIGTSAAKLRQEIREKGLATAMLDLVQNFEGNEAALAEIVPNVRALAGIMGVTGKQADEFRRISASLNGELNLLAEGFERTSETPAFKFAQLKARAEELGVTIGNQLLPGLISVAEAMTPVISMVGKLAEGFGALPGWIQGTVLAIGGIVAVAGPLLVILGGIVTGLGAVVSALGATLPAWGAMAAVLVPGGAVAIAIAAAVAGLALLKRNVQETAEQSEEAFNKMSRGLMDVATDELEVRLGRAQDRAREMADELVRAMEAGADENQVEVLRRNLQITQTSLTRLNKELERRKALLEEGGGGDDGGAAGGSDLEELERNLAEQFDMEARKDELLARQGLISLDRQKALLDERLAAVEQAGLTESDLYLSLQEERLSLEEEITRKHETELQKRQQLEEQWTAFRLATGQMSKMERIRQIDEELEAAEAGSQRQLELERERFRLVSGFIQARIQEIQGAGSQMNAGTIASLEELKTKLQELGPEYANLVNIIDEAITDSSEKTAASADDMKTDLARKGSSAGQALARGLIDGTLDMQDFVKSQFAQFVQFAITRVFTSQLGIASPSKVARGWGENLGQGLVQGMGKSEGMVRNAAATLAGAMQTPFTSPDLALTGRGLPGRALAGSRGLAAPTRDVTAPRRSLEEALASLPTPGDPILAAREGEVQRFVAEAMFALRDSGVRFD